MALEEVRGGGVEVYLVTDSLNLRGHVRRIANNVSEKRLKVEETERDRQKEREKWWKKTEISRRSMEQ